MRKFIGVCFLLLAIGAVLPVAATPLPVGGSVTPFDNSPSTFPNLGLQILPGGGISGTFATPAGSVKERVYIDSVTGKLDFLYQVTPTSGSPSVTGFSVDGYKGPGVTTNVEQSNFLNKSNTTGNKIFSTGARSGGAGDVLTFTLLSGTSGAPASHFPYYILVRTNSSGYVTDETMTINTATGDRTVTGLARPTAAVPVPEPATILIWSSIVSGMGFMSWRKRKRATSEPIS